MGELIDSGVGGKVDPWTNEDVPDFPLDTSGPGQAFPRGSVDLSFPQVFMVDQDGPSSSGGGRRRIDIEHLLNSEAEGEKVQWTQEDEYGRSMAAAPIPSDMDNGRTRLEMDTEAPTERSAGLKRAPSKKAKTCRELSNLYRLMQRGDASVNGSSGLAHAQTKRRPARANNYRNTCFANAMIQAVNAAVPVLPAAELENPLFETCALLCNPNLQIKTAHDALLQALGEVGVDPARQQDPHEAYIKLVARFDMLHHLGEFMVSTNFSCDGCGKASKHVEKLSPAVLSLAIPPNNGETTLASCLSKYFRDEKVERKCEACNHNSASKKVAVRADPQSLPQRSLPTCCTRARQRIEDTILPWWESGFVQMINLFGREPRSVSASVERHGAPIDIYKSVYLIFGRLSLPARAFGALEEHTQCLGLVPQTGSTADHKTWDEPQENLHEQQQRESAKLSIKCHCGNELRERLSTSKKNSGRAYFGCEARPSCGFFLWKSHTLVACTNTCHCGKAAHVWEEKNGTKTWRCNRSREKCLFKMTCPADDKGKTGSNPENSGTGGLATSSSSSSSASSSSPSASLFSSPTLNPQAAAQEQQRLPFASKEGRKKKSAALRWTLRL
eukprot:g2098.t1